MQIPLLGHNREDVAGIEKQQVLTVVLDLGTAVLAEDHDVALGDIEEIGRASCRERVCELV